MTSAPKGYEDKVFMIKGDLKEIVDNLNHKDFKNLYIAGGMTIQNFLEAGLIDEITITTIPVFLVAGIPLFGERGNRKNFRCPSLSSDK